jgi:hypothetical protein
VGDIMLFVTVLGAVVAALATVVAIVLIYSFAHRAAPAASGSTPSRARQTECDVSGGTGGSVPAADPTAWQSATVSDLVAAEELLARAEEEGYPERELIVLGNSTFLVRWRGRV